MKRSITLLVAIMLLATLTVGVVATEPLYPVIDEANLLTEQEMQLLSTVFNQYGAMSYQVLTLETLNGESAQSYAERVADENQIGVLLLVSMQEREWWITTSGEYVEMFDDTTLMQIEDAFLPYLSAGEYYRAFEMFAKQCDAAEAAYWQAPAYTPDDKEDWEYTDVPEKQKEQGSAFLICLGIGLVLSLITVGIMAAQLKSVRPQNSAGSYIRSGSMRLTMSRDIFLYQNTVRHAKPQHNSPGSSSGFSGGGGHSHGGRGGKF